MGGVSLHRFDQVGNQIVAALELYIDIRPSVIALNPEPYESVVNKDDREREHGNDDQDRHHLAASFERKELGKAKIRPVSFSQYGHRLCLCKERRPNVRLNSKK
jgi:hypothetical protein